MNKSNTVLRLDRLLSNLGYGTRKEIHAFVKAGHITLDGMTVADASRKLALTANLPERLYVAGEKLDPLPGLTLAMNKPLGLTCSHKEAGALVYDLLPPRWRLRKPAISTVGRLDKETSGLLLLTDDGALLHRIISPKSKVPKRYRATLSHPLRGNEVELFASGTLLLEGENKPLLPALLEVPECGPEGLSEHRPPKLSSPVAILTIAEGRYHQVRRMFAAVGNRVTALHRMSIGGLSLPCDLSEGAYRSLASAEIACIFAQART